MKKKGTRKSHASHPSRTQFNVASNVNPSTPVSSQIKKRKKKEKNRKDLSSSINHQAQASKRSKKEMQQMQLERKKDCCFLQTANRSKIRIKSQISM